MIQSITGTQRWAGAGGGHAAPRPASANAEAGTELHEAGANGGMLLTWRQIELEHEV